MSVLAELSMFPVDKGESVSQYVTEAVKVIRNSGLDYSLGPMGTCIEGDWDEVIKVISDCFNVLKEKSNRVYMVLKVDYRKGKENRIASKVSSVLEKLE